MNPQQSAELVRRLINQIAPEADLDALDARADMREALDLDSMDILRLATALHEATGLEIPEREYGEICSLQRCIDYLTKRSAS